MRREYNREALVKTLADDYGIYSPKDLKRALKTSAPLDISQFVCPLPCKQSSKQKVKQTAS